jgi:hypothetical protein
MFETYIKNEPLALTFLTWRDAVLAGAGNIKLNSDVGSNGVVIYKNNEIAGVI